MPTEMFQLHTSERDRNAKIVQKQNRNSLVFFYSSRSKERFKGWDLLRVFGFADRLFQKIIKKNQLEAVIGF